MTALSGREFYKYIMYGGVNENDPHNLMYLSAWVPISGTVWEGLGGVALWEELCHWDGL